MESPSMNGGPHPRASSPPSGFSILITSAPMSPRIMPAIGPATACPISITLMPASSPSIAFLLQVLWPRRRRSDHWIPCDRNQTVLRAVVLHMPDGRECEVEARHQRFFGGGHVVKLVPGRLRLHRIDVIGHMPVRIAQEEFRDVGDIGLDQDSGVSGCDRKGGVTRRVARRLNRSDPGGDFLAPIVFRYLGF